MRLHKLVRKDTGQAEGATREPVWAVARFAPAVARRHFEQAKWGGKQAERALVVKSVSVLWSPGPSYEVKVVVDRYEGEHRLGQATVTALDNAFYQLAAVWSGEQLTAQYRADAEAMMKKSQPAAPKKAKTR